MVFCPLIRQLSYFLSSVLTVNRYSCRLWGTYLMYDVVIHHMNDAGLMGEAGLVDKASFLSFWTRVIFLLFSDDVKHDVTQQ